MKAANNEAVIKLAALVSDRIDRLSSHKSQKEIAKEVGFPSTNAISIFKRGEMKLPLDRVARMATALELPEEKLMFMAMRQYFSDEVIAEIKRALNDEVTEAEREILTMIRKTIKPGSNITKETKERIQEALQANVSAKE